MREVKEDFDRWWVTATFEEKMSMALLAAIIIQMILFPMAAILRSFKA